MNAPQKPTPPKSRNHESPDLPVSAHERIQPSRKEPTRLTPKVAQGNPGPECSNPSSAQPTPYRERAPKAPPRATHTEGNRQLFFTLEYQANFSTKPGWRNSGDVADMGSSRKEPQDRFMSRVGLPTKRRGRIRKNAFPRASYRFSCGLRV